MVYLHITLYLDELYILYLYRYYVICYVLAILFINPNNLNLSFYYIIFDIFRCVEDKLYNIIKDINKQTYSIELHLYHF